MIRPGGGGVTHPHTPPQVSPLDQDPVRYFLEVDVTFNTILPISIDAWAYGKEKIRGAERNLPDFFGLCPTNPENFFV